MGGVPVWGYRLLKRAWRQIHDDIEGPDLDRQDVGLVFRPCWRRWLGKAQRNPGAVVAAIRQLDWMCGLGISSHAVHGSTVRGCDYSPTEPNLQARKLMSGRYPPEAKGGMTLVSISLKFKPRLPLAV